MTERESYFFPSFYALKEFPKVSNIPNVMVNRVELDNVTLKRYIKLDR